MSEFFFGKSHWPNAVVVIELSVPLEIHMANGSRMCFRVCVWCQAHWFFRNLGAKEILSDFYFFNGTYIKRRVFLKTHNIFLSTQTNPNDLGNIEVILEHIDLDLSNDAVRMGCEFEKEKMFDAFFVRIRSKLHFLFVSFGKKLWNMSLNLFQ